jgi:hypothetical protein
MRAVHALAIAIAGLGACAGNADDAPYRPGGGGGGGTSHGGDAGVRDAAGDGDGGGGGTLNGVICVVSSLLAPEACGSGTEQSGVTVAVLGGSASTVSGTNGQFSLAVTGSSVVIDAADGSATLEHVYVPVTVSDSTVSTPVVTTAAFNAAINSLTTVVPDGGGTVVAYVDDGTSPGVGVAFSTIAGSSVAPWYDDGSNTSWQQGTGTGVAGVALFVNVPVGTVSIDGTAPDSRVAQRSGIPVAADTVTFVRVALVTPP